MVKERPKSRQYNKRLQPRTIDQLNALEAGGFTLDAMAVMMTMVAEKAAEGGITEPVKVWLWLQERLGPMVRGK